MSCLYLVTISTVVGGGSGEGGGGLCINSKEASGKQNLYHFGA